MSTRPVTFDDMIAFWKWLYTQDGETVAWWSKRLADGAGTRGAITDPCAGAMTATSTSPNATATTPSAGGTASGAGSVAAAVEALRVAIADNRGVYLAANNLLALDVPGRIAKAEADAAKLRTELAEAREAHRISIATFGDAPKLREQLAAAQSVAKNWKFNFDMLAHNADRAHEALRIEREACDAWRKGALETVPGYPGVWRARDDGIFRLAEAHDARRAAEKNGDQTCEKKQPLGSNGSVTTSAPSSEPRSSSDSFSKPSEARSSAGVATTIDQPTVTDEDRRLVEPPRVKGGKWTVVDRHERGSSVASVRTTDGRREWWNGYYQASIAVDVASLLNQVDQLTMDAEMWKGLAVRLRDSIKRCHGGDERSRAIAEGALNDFDNALVARFGGGK